MASRGLQSAHDLVLLHGLSDAEKALAMSRDLTRLGGWPSLKKARDTAGHFFCREFPERHVDVVAASAHTPTDKRIVRAALSCLAANAPDVSGIRRFSGPLDLQLSIRSDLRLKCHLDFGYRAGGPPVWVYFQGRIGGRPSDPQLAMLLAILREAIYNYHPESLVAVVDVGGPHNTLRQFRHLTEVDVGTVSSAEVQTFLQEMAHLRDEIIKTIDWDEQALRKASFNAERARRSAEKKRPLGPEGDLFGGSEEG